MKKIIVRRTQRETAVHDLPAHLHPVLRRIYLARKLHAACELECSLDRLLPFTSLQGTATAQLVAPSASKSATINKRFCSCSAATSNSTAAAVPCNEVKGNRRSSEHSSSQAACSLRAR